MRRSYAVVMICPACGAPVSDGARFCASCGREVRPPGDERRIVTVLFGDLVGFTSLSENLDPEQVKNVVDRCFDRLATDVREFGGQVDKVIGDAIVAMFGAPIAHEDDAERAVRAALRMQTTMIGLAAEVGHDLRMRIGVNTGEVLVGSMRAAGSITTMGDVVNTASRLQSAGRPGDVLVGAATYAGTQAVIRYESRGLLNAKGREEPVETWAALETILPPGYRARRIDVPMVGREHELGLLHHAVETAITHERALFTLLLGDPGLGKTRLAEEVGDWAALTHGATVLEGRCVPYGEANVWWPIAEVLRSGCGVEIDAPAPQARAATARRVAQAFERPETDAEVTRTVDGLMILMGYETSKGADPASMRDEAVRSIVAFVEQSTRHAPLVLQLSDLHWADDLVLDLIKELFERLHHCPAVVIATARPALSERWGPSPGRHNSLVLHVDPLGREAAGRLLEALMCRMPSAEVADALVERSGGNPFFLEELVSLLDDGEAVTAGTGPHGSTRFAELPDTLRGLVAARLDDLDADSKIVLQDAAVIGRHSVVSGLRQMAAKMGRAVDVDAGVRVLVDKEILVVEGGEWSFRSDLVREVAYQTITKSDRVKRHLGIAMFLEHEVWPNHPSSATLVDQLAAHYGTAVELAAELGVRAELPEGVCERALTWVTTAAEQARVGGVLPTAIRLFTQALGLVDDDRPSAARARLLLGRGCAHEETWHLVDARADAAAAAAEATASGDEATG
ncbi:MAG: Adenylate cyclase, partial [Acidimicrobiales bacterium]|nr:Adenylate cyclase [Acidimicrobiales bacterium]